MPEVYGEYKCGKVELLEESDREYPIYQLNLEDLTHVTMNQFDDLMYGRDIKFNSVADDPLDRIYNFDTSKKTYYYIYKREVFCIEDEYIPLKQYEDQPDPDDSEDVEHSSEDDDGASGVILAEEDGGDYVQPSDTCPMVI